MEFVTGFKHNHQGKVQNLKSQIEKMKYERDRIQHSKGKGEEIEQDVQSWLTHAEDKIKEEEEIVKSLEAEAKKRCFIGLCPNFKSLNQLYKVAEENAKAILELIQQAESHKFNNKSNVQNLENQAEAEKRNRMMDVEQDKKTNDEAEKVNKVEDKEENKSLVWLYPKFKSPNQVSNSAEDDGRVIGSELIEQHRFDGGLYPARSQETESMPIQCYKAFESRKDTMENIMKALKDPDFKIIGVYGMAGVGKTVLVKEVMRKVRAESLFDEVAMATVSRNPNIKEIQGKITDALGLKFDEEIVFGRAMRLQQWLKKEDKRVLLVLDDVWLGLDLEEVGIAFEGYQNIASEEDLGPMIQNINGNAFQKFSAVRLKMLLTSTSQEVLNHMKTEMNFEVEVLTNEEAMVWFEKIVGDTAMQPSNPQIVTRVVKNCAGFPVAISGIAAALKIRGFNILVEALPEERKPIPTKAENLRSVYLTIQLSYSLLKKPKLQSLFQLCALLPQGSDIRVSDLLRYNLGVKIARNVSTLEKASKSVNKLKDAGLLSGDNDELVKMHDIVRDVFIWIASEDKQMFVIEDEIRLEELLKQRKLKNCTAISLPFSNIHELPCRSLDLSNCSKLKVIPAEIISGLSNLEELFLCNSFDQWGVEGNASLIELMPLTCLTTLDLHIRSAQDWPAELFFEKLDRYKILIGEVWKWSGKYEKRRILKLKLTKGIHLDHGVKLLLQKTEDLYLDELKGIKNLLYELDSTGFPQLKNLHIQNGNEIQFIINSTKVVSGKAFPILESLFLQNLINLEKICQGKLEEECFKRMNIISVKCCDGLKNLFSYSMTKMLLHLQEIKVINCKSIEEIVVEVREKSTSVATNKTEFCELRSLTLQLLPELGSFCSKGKSHSIYQQEPVNTRSWLLFNGKVVFPVLENLRLSAINIERIWQKTSYCSQNLTSLVIEGCGNLKHLFSPSIIKGQSQLKSFEIIDCKHIREIIVPEEAEVEEEEKEEEGKKKRKRNV
ncbi:Cc-nbs-lrr resistance-like protein [Theobroma cacao]|uniref:Cc-nbs-lrr resistance-like protein n=1 Tax=Theobroma cacao TaxID=3641 RepID=A0A061DN22_THECC|nr:Cc-nbs-lrr resistance-like protein [Theobroma cacao]